VDVVVYDCPIRNPLNSPTGALNDLWKYKVNEDKWIWISGSNTTEQEGVYDGDNKVPGARFDAVGCYDSLRQEFWLFGGIGYIATGSGAFVRR